MAAIGLVELRHLLDEAITYADLSLARKLAEEGVRTAERRALPGEVMYFRAQEEIIAENFPAAIRYLDRAIQLNPKDGAAYNDRALCRIESGAIDDALADLDRGIEVEPDYATVYHNKGWLLNMLGQHEQAMSFFAKALELEPDRAVTYENMADALLGLGKIPDAICALRSALALLKPAYRDIRQQIEARLRQIENH